MVSGRPRPARRRRRGRGELGTPRRFAVADAHSVDRPRGRPAVPAVGQRPGRCLVPPHQASHQGRIEARGVVRDVTWVNVDAAGQPDVDPAVDAEYARKYQGAMSAIAHITSPLARATTMRVEPR